jgi:hypothetical protein
MTKKVVKPDCLLNYLSYVNHRVKDILYTENISAGKEVKLGEGLMLKYTLPRKDKL